ncbi:hypothetical protein E1C95_09145 [Salmonella enterica subsp. enterica serovar Bonariensis]|nr:hypothetical protein [Salmonella enterica subsp. enterica serovar Bonariensis]EDX1477306.1 hypothetical protein [Salmonella enterica subsp. enterica serovar Bonariensis]EEP1478927.1 hypothetical protein [Salmonella enterica]EHL9624002.1 hypothetical protein [Salmonella enterica subsp. enterica serovar Bonariensis]
MAKVKWPKLPRYLIPLFQCANVYLCRSRGEWYQASEALGCQRGDVDMLSGATQTYCNAETGEALYLLGVFDGELSTLAHECAHIAFYVCRDTGVVVHEEGANETYCYLVGGLFKFGEGHLKKPAGLEPV